MSSNTSASGNNNNENTVPPDARLRLVEHAAAATTTTTTPRITTSADSRQSSSHAANDVVDAASTSPTNKNNNNNNTKHDKEADGTSSTSETRYGKCKWFNVAKGWGFITPNDGGVEVFVHQSVIQMNGFRSLGEQEDVEFESEVTPRGVEATRVAGREGFDCVGSNFRPRPHGARFVRRVRCYNCNKFNHIAVECRLEPQPRRCYICQQEDHLIADCPRTATQPITASANTSVSSAPAEGEPNDT